MNNPNLTIDVFSDVVCPWCYLGKRRLEAALSQLPDRKVEVHWRPFRLDPTIPTGGVPRDTYLIQKFGSLAAIEPAHEKLAESGRREGIDYRFDKITRSPNTIDAHRLVRWGEVEGRQDAIVEHLFAAYFSEGRDVGDQSELAALAREAGMTGDVAARLATDDDVLTTEQEVEAAYRMGITGVPCFVINRRFGVMGAQTPEVLLDAIRQAEAPPAAGTEAV